MTVRLARTHEPAPRSWRRLCVGGVGFDDLLADPALSPAPPSGRSAPCDGPDGPRSVVVGAIAFSWEDVLAVLGFPAAFQTAQRHQGSIAAVPELPQLASGTAADDARRN